MIAPETQKVMDALREGGGDARFVGGCVRNALSNRKVLDIDIATPLVPEEVMARLTRHKIPYVPTGLKHGTVTAIVDGHPFEITTLRLDVATFGRHAEVKFTDDWAADASRRDFTINAMFCTPEGQIFDPFGGVKDLRLGRVRFVGDAGQRIQEDVLRILRFFRFYAHFGKGEPDAAAIAACTTAAPEISKLSAERIRQEVLKLLESDHCPAVWQLMFRCGIAQDVLPAATRVTFLENLVNLEAEHHSPAFPLRRLAAVLDVGLCQVEKASQALRLSNDQVAQLRDMMNPPAEVSVEMAEATVRRYTYTLGNDTMRNLLLLSAARSSRKGNLDQLYHVATTFRAPRFPLTGADVLNLGYTPGPEVGRVLAGIESWWIDQDFSPGRTECLQKLSGEFPRKPR
ncbi:MAG: CCA tRNA nucleotidyltransferase [Proteobacteria bacterium]|nr:CCA tRNA nucleotidyltransferase [Pseudomonadota bacterium]